jgi:hypothetical protein
MMARWPAAWVRQPHIRAALGLDRVFAQVGWGGLPSALVGESIARYATDFAPALRAA